VVLVIARFVPGGRAASTFVAGRTAYPLLPLHGDRVGGERGPVRLSFGYLGTASDQTLLATGLGIRWRWRSAG
jgi:hypothetical protein